MTDAEAQTPSHSPASREDALAVLKRLRESGHVAYFAGGCVRDQLLGLTPKDFDIATDAAPSRVRELFSNTQAVGAAFGVILVRHRRSVIEVATFRTEGDYTDGRRPNAVRFTTAEEDAQRRDFTINGLFLDPITNEVIDFVGGQEDLKARRLRAIGDPDERFAEDHLRLLRAVRFASRFGLTIEPRTAEAIRRHAPRIVRISPERIAEELRRMLTPPSRNAAWEMLWEFALIDQIFRFVGPAEDVAFDAGRSIFLKLPATSIPFGLALAAANLCYLMQPRGSLDIRPLLTHDSVNKISRAMRQALKISNEELDEMAGTLRAIAPLLEDEPPALAKLMRFVASPYSRGAQVLLNCLAQVNCHAERIAQLSEAIQRLQNVDCSPPPLITGDDLTAAGLRPGPVFKQILESVYDAQLEGKIKTQAEAMEMALRLVL